MTSVRPARPRRAMTLVEMLIATTMTLIIMGVVAQLFSLLGRSVSGSKSTTSMGEQLRGVAQMLRNDLSGVTASTLPPARPESDLGYLEIIEGPMTDTSSGAVSLTADCDDILMFTTRSLGSPFVGIYNGNSSIESQFAEVAWFCRQSADQPVPGTTLFTLYRRQLLALAYVGAEPFFSGSNSIVAPGGGWPAFYFNYDLSCRLEGGRLWPNSLGDLTKRENRFLHQSVFPFYFDGSQPGLVLTGSNREANDVVLTNIVGFDVRIFDPSAAITSAVPAATGAYVNLNWNNESTPVAIGSTFPVTGKTAFQGVGMSYVNNATTKMLFPTYDTWSLHYEFNGIDEDGVYGADQGTNGQDDNNNGLVDEAQEAETSAPYPVPLRGLEVRIRCYEPSSRQVRQITVRHTFVPH